MKTATFMLVMVGLTSVGTYVVGVAWLRLPAGAINTAIGRVLECVGATLAFAVLNVSLATAVVLTLRAVTGRFVSVYLVNDDTWLAFSLLQGLTFHWWRELARARQRANRP